MTTLQDLLERVENAEGPDRELDALIGAMFKQPFKARKNYSNRWVGSVRQHASVRHVYPNYTASLDAAIALTEAVLPGWWRQGRQKFGGDGRYWDIALTTVEPPHFASGQHKSEPLALIIALLKALIAKESAQ